MTEIAPSLQREAQQYFRAIRQTLINRGLCDRRKDGTIREVAWRGWTPRWYDNEGRPHALAFVVDIYQLPQAAGIEKLRDRHLLEQISAALAGRVVLAVNHHGLAFVVGRGVPEPVERRLPASVDLDLGARPPGQYMVPIGEGPAGPVWRSLAELDAVLIGGTRRLGKSMLANTWLAALLSRHTPDELRVALVDPKEVELAAWAEAPHLLGPVATNAAEAEALLGQVMGELEIRRALFRQAGVTNLTEYNAEAGDGRRLPAALVVVDELADLALEAGGAKSGPLPLLARLVAKGGAFGLHAVLCLQRPDADSVAGFLKANLATRIAFWFPSALDYRLALDLRAGEVPSLPRRPGRMIARLPDGLHVLQGYHLPLDARRQLAARVAAGETAPAGVLSEAEEAMVRWALAENGGYLALADIQERLDVGPSPARRLAGDWERFGWLEKDRANRNKRRVTDALAALVAEFEALAVADRQSDDLFSEFVAGQFDEIGAV